MSNKTSDMFVVVSCVHNHSKYSCECSQSQQKQQWFHYITSLICCMINDSTCRSTSQHNIKENHTLTLFHHLVSPLDFEFCKRLHAYIHICCWTLELTDLFDIIDVVKSRQCIVLSIFKRVKKSFILSLKFIGGK